MTPLFVTDHAILRYIERVLDFDLDQIRHRIRNICEEPAAAGAVAITYEGFTYMFSPDRTKVVTVKPAQPKNRKGRR